LSSIEVCPLVTRGVGTLRRAGNGPFVQRALQTASPLPDSNRRPLVAPRHAARSARTTHSGRAPRPLIASSSRSARTAPSAVGRTSTSRTSASSRSRATPTRRSRAAGCATATDMIADRIVATRRRRGRTRSQTARRSGARSASASSAARPSTPRRTTCSSSSSPRPARCRWRTRPHRTAYSSRVAANRTPQQTAAASRPPICFQPLPSGLRDPPTKPRLNDETRRFQRVP
jgi:hypothetical protein